MPIDIVQHLGNRNYAPSIQRRRVVWSVIEPFFRASPQVCYGWRNILLRLLGARIGENVRLHPSVRVTFPWNLNISDHVVIGARTQLYALAKISIGSNVLISHGAHLCTGSHDYRQPNFPIAHRPIHIETGSWIAVEAFVGPGVTVGRGAIVGARAVAMHDVPALTLSAGNPAQVIRSLVD